MIKVINSDLLDQIHNEYSKSEFFFPLIGSVISQSQKGDVFVDSETYPNIILVVHKSRFAQIIKGVDSENTYEQIVNFLSGSTDFKGESFDKIRFYNASDLFIDFMNNNDIYSSMDGMRVRFFWDREIDVPEDSSILEIQNENIESLDSIHNLDSGTRFWDNHNDFLNFSHARCINENSTVLSVCYAAALDNQMAEIDVSTHPEYRKLGLAEKVSQEFARVCIEDGVLPVWDCYQDNIGSMKTAEKLKFVERYRYRFLILTKK